MNKLERYYCIKCGSSNVQVQAWVDANTHKFFTEIGDPLEDGDCWCMDCDNNTGLYHIDELWDLFTDVPINSDDEIEEKFLSFPAGTNRFTIWGWFYERFPKHVAKKVFPKWYIKNKNNI